jgi:hypothetical protein
MISTCRRSGDRVGAALDAAGRDQTGGTSHVGPTRRADAEKGVATHKGGVVGTKVGGAGEGQCLYYAWLGSCFTEARAGLFTNGRDLYNWLSVVV